MRCEIVHTHQYERGKVVRGEGGGGRGGECSERGKGEVVRGGKG